MTTRDCEKPIILFEPIIRGSRAQILANVIAAIRSVSSRTIRVVTRSDFSTSHVQQLLNGIVPPVEFFPAATDLNGQWIKNLDRREFGHMLEALHSALTLDPTSDVVFMAMDDYMVSMGMTVHRIRAAFPACRMWVIKYRSEFLLHDAYTSLRLLALKILFGWIVKRLKSQVIVFDERLTGRTLDGRPLAVIPDPWFGDFSPSIRKLARARYGYTDADYVILALGRQDFRKGFPTILGALPRILDEGSCKLFVVGAIAPQYLDEFSSLKIRYASRIKHIAEFVPESELAEIFGCADVFLLPYARDFTATSGTLPRAAAAGVPVVASGHGLVGHRVRAHGLGVTCGAGKSDQLATALRSMQTMSADAVAVTKHNLHLFSLGANLTAFKSAVVRALSTRNAT